MLEDDEDYEDDAGGGGGGNDGNGDVADTTADDGDDVIEGSAMPCLRECAIYGVKLQEVRTSWG